MSPEAPVHRFVDAFNQRDLAGIGTLYAQDAVSHIPFYPEPLKGREAITAVIPGQWTAFPDVRMELRHPVVASGNHTAHEIAEERAYFDATAVAMQLGIVG